MRRLGYYHNNADTHTHTHTHTDTGAIRWHSENWEHAGMESQGLLSPYSSHRGEYSHY